MNRSLFAWILAVAGIVLLAASVVMQGMILVRLNRPRSTPVELQGISMSGYVPVSIQEVNTVENLPVSISDVDTFKPMPVVIQR